MNGDGQAEAPLRSGSAGTISPDGLWLAYESSESGQSEVYVSPFPGVEEGLWPVSNGYGTSPVWGRDGHELFYQTRVGTDMAVTLMAVAYDTEPTFRPATPVALFEGPYRLGTRAFDASRDGQRFLVIKEAAGEPSDQTEVIVVQNWTEELKRLIPVD